jgi:uncharacterized protein YjbJ (UPF0337 family)
MGEKGDQVKGRVKEAAGVLTGDTDLESEGPSHALVIDAIIPLTCRA